MNKQPSLSRSALEQYIRCPCCFYQQRRLGLKPIPGIPLTLAVATDALLKNEFDAIRGTDSMHPAWENVGVPLRAFSHPDIDSWRNNRQGVRALHSSGTEIYGAVDDIWENRETGELHVVDYKSTSKQGNPSIDEGWGDGYKRQAEIYLWLLRQRGFPTSRTAFFLYVNASKQGLFYRQGTLDGEMRFTTTIIPYVGNDEWVDAAISRAVECLRGDRAPTPLESCDTCRFFVSRAELEATTRR